MAPNPLLKYASRWRDQRVGLYGGSFNPAHEGHRYIAHSAIKRLRLDCLWVMVSPGNPLKAEADMADWPARMASARAIIGSHQKIIYSDVEQRLGTRYTADLVNKLVNGMPNTSFVWVMGADNLQQFPKWRAYEEIANLVPIAVFDRPGYSVASLGGEFAQKYRRFYQPERSFHLGSAPAWTFIQIPRHKSSATDIRKNAKDDWWRER